jgi:secreted Zn-dependent insulinase-like peptidase
MRLDSTSAAQVDEIEINDVNLLEVPGNTDNEYGQFKMKNGIEVTCVRIANSEKSAATMAVKVGAMDDTLAGLAHFTEHAVFLGSVAFPQEDKFKAHLSKNAGSSNGGTSMDTTTFQFEVNKDALESTLEIWSNFFLRPLFRDDAIAREVMAVTAEDSKNRILDGRRVLQVMKDLMEPPCITDWTKFSTGNVNTLCLGADKAEENAKELATIMKRFHAMHYKPCKMCLSLTGPQGLSELKRLAVQHFEGIEAPEESDDGGLELLNFPAGSLPQQNSPDVAGNESKNSFWARKNEAYKQKSQFNAGYPFRREVLGTLVRVKPVKDVRDVSIMVGLPPVKGQYRKSPLRLLAQLISYQGVGSLFAALQDLKWATSASGGTRVSTPEFSVFEVSVSLTPMGYQHYEKVIELVYAHLRHLLSCSDNEYMRLWQETRANSRIGFDYQEKASAYSLAQHLSRQMAHYPLEHALSEGWLLDPMTSEDVTRVKEMLAVIANPAQSVTMLRNREAFSAFLPDDEQFAITEEKACELFPTMLATESVSDLVNEGGEVSEGGEVTGVPTGPNRVELNYGLPYHVQKMVESASTEVSAAIGMESAVAAILARQQDSSSSAFDGLSEGLVSGIRSGFPPPNPYICTAEELAVYSPPQTEDGIKVNTTGSDPPTTIILKHESAPEPAKDSGDSTRARFVREGVYRSSDQMFRQPRTQINTFVQSYTGADSHPVNGLIAAVFYQAVATRFYPARLAGLGFTVSAGPRGVGFSFYGYSPKLAAFASDVVSTFTSEEFWRGLDPALVEACVERTVRRLQSWRKDRPDSLAEGMLSYLMSESARHLPDEKLQLAKSIDHSVFLERALSIATANKNVESSTSSRIGIRSYMHGSLGEEQLMAVHSSVKYALGLSTPHDLASIDALKKMQDSVGYGMTDPPCLARMLPRASHSLLAMQTPNEEDENSALLVHFQTDRMSPVTSATMLFLRRYLHQPMFDKLRTKKQLGYIVSMSSSGFGTTRGLRSIRGFTARILSNRYSPPVMQRELEVFLRDMETTISGLTQEDVEERVKALVATLRDPPTSYREEADDFWGNIIDERGFDWTERVIAQLEKLTPECIGDCYQRWFLNAQGDHRSVSVMLFGKGKTVSLSGQHDGQMEEGCEVGTLAPEKTVFPPLTAYSSASRGDGQYNQEQGHQSGSGVSPGLLVTRMEDLKEIRESLDLFSPVPEPPAGQ